MLFLPYKPLNIFNIKILNIYYPLRYVYLCMFRIISVLIFKLKGWKVNIDPQLIKKNKQLVLIGVPHTSNWDAVYFTGATFLGKIKTRFLIKKEWMRFPLNLIFKPIGGLAVDNKAKKTLACVCVYCCPGWAKKMF